MGYSVELKFPIFYKNDLTIDRISRWRKKMKRLSSLNVISILILTSILGSSCTLPVCTASEIVVTRTEDVTSGVCEVESCSLRQAILAANACSGNQVIRVPAGTYTLTRTGAGEDSSARGDLDITDDVQLIGSGMPIVDGNNADRVFDIHDGVTVNMTGLVIQNGLYVSAGVSGESGGIQNRGNFTANGIVIRNNTGRVTGNGAGGFSNGSGAIAVISHSAIISNYSEEGAGGVINFGTMTLDNVTISGNDAYGISTAGPLEIRYSTIADNKVVQIWMGAPAVAPVISNSIVAGFPDAAGCFGLDPISNGFNIEYSEAGTDRLCNFTGPNDLADTDPMLLPLSSYDRISPPVHALDALSPAIDSADAANCSGTDQRGTTRPQGVGCDRGAYEWQEDLSLPELPVATAPPEFEPPELVPFVLVIQVGANCRQGPSVVYPVVNSALQGEEVQVLGKSEDGQWWYSQVDQDKCFISNIAGTPQGDLNLLAIIPAPPTPVPTKTPVVEEKPKPTQTEALVDDDGDGYPFSLDCNDKNAKIHPGAVETPDDKVDSNCNGDDDK
jgi:CSLREA domain-containing protein